MNLRVGGYLPLLTVALLGLPRAEAAENCPAQFNATELCAAVGAQLSETNPAMGTRFSYQTKINAASCVVKTDSTDVARSKIRDFWRKNQHRLVCNEFGSMVRSGSILKLAVEKDSREFVNDTVRRWKVDLNHVDMSDGKTVMDYIDDELKGASGTPRESGLRRYQELFRRAGAKKAGELGQG